MHAAYNAEGTSSGRLARLVLLGARNKNYRHYIYNENNIKTTNWTVKDINKENMDVAGPKNLMPLRQNIEIWQWVRRFWSKSGIWDRKSCDFRRAHQNFVRFRECANVLGQSSQRIIEVPVNEAAAAAAPKRWHGYPIPYSYSSTKLKLQFRF